MHQCLSIFEVQLSIFREVHCSATLARLARTCHAFNNTALDLLWEDLDSFVHLIQCLPHDLHKSGSNRVEFKRAILLKDWEILFKYSARIRACRFVDQSPRLSNDVMFALSLPPNHAPLIPHLKSLYWDKPLESYAYASLLRSLLTPSLVNLSLSSCVLDCPEVSVLACIGTICRSLKNLHIASNRPLLSFHRQDKEALSGVLLYQHSLESLRCPILDEAAIVHLSRLPRLAELSLAVNTLRMEKVRPFVKPPMFESIVSLTLRAVELSTLTALLEALKFKPRSVAFAVEEDPESDELRFFFLALVSACSPEELTSFSLTKNHDWREFPEVPQCVALSTLQPLIALSNMREFKLEVQCYISLDDKAMTMLAKHWPRLNTLMINVKSGWGIPSRVTHKGLVTLLTCCPGITEFALAIDFSEIDTPRIEIPELCLNANNDCRVAHFVTSTITFPIVVAAFLSDVCPKLEVIKSSWGEGMSASHLEHHGVTRGEVDGLQDRWEDVKKLMPAFPAMRKQCMDWAMRRLPEGDLGPA